MKAFIGYIVFVVLLFACQSNPYQQTISRVEDYNKKLRHITATSAARLDTSAINKEFNDQGITAINMQAMREISDESSFKELLRTERGVLERWEKIPNFPSYSAVNPDTLLQLIRRCSAFDRAPADIERVPVARGMRAISLDYYKVEVPIAFHIIVNQQGVVLQGNMSDRINNQIQVLNSVYNKFNIIFKLNSIDTTINDTWFDRASYYTDQNALRQMTSSLSKNPGKIMNVYALGSQQVLGESAFPWYPEKGTSMDYIVINYNTLPGGPNTFFDGKYNEGKTLVHEAGHFLGLLHTFEGANAVCSSSRNDGCNIGDQVDDTPSQKLCYFDGCDGNADSCPAPGKDPVKNFMGYNPDACMNEMTQGQGDRLIQSIVKFRYYLITNPI